LAVAFQKTTVLAAVKGFLNALGGFVALDPLLS